MIIEINGTEFQNKGAEMMLLSIIDKVSERIPDAKFTMRPGINAHYKNYSSIGIYPKAFTDLRSFRFGKIINKIPQELLKRYGWIKDSEVDVLLDASGFAYSSEWGENMTNRMAKECSIRKKYGTKIIFLPQAFGPFNTKKIKHNIQTIVKHSDIIYARESESYNNLINIPESRNSNIKTSPDFTCTLKGELPDNYQKQGNACIIPNVRMIDKTDITRNEYIQFIIKLIEKLKTNSLNPFFLVHSVGEDNILVDEINKILGDGLPIIIESNPRHIKGIISKVDVLFSSRFHGLVNGLIQGIPSYGTGWSHKYKLLFNDFDFPQGMLDISNPVLDNISTNTERTDISKKLLTKADIYKEKVNAMWSEIFNEIL